MKQTISYIYSTTLIKIIPVNVSNTGYLVIYVKDCSRWFLSLYLKDCSDCISLSSTGRSAGCIKIMLLTPDSLTLTSTPDCPMSTPSYTLHAACMSIVKHRLCSIIHGVFYRRRFLFHDPRASIKRSARTYIANLSLTSDIGQSRRRLLQDGWMEASNLGTIFCEAESR